MTRVFIYVVDRDFGFAPNPFHGICTLATCKPNIRSSAIVGDWVIGMGGARLNATGLCIFAMRISRKISFDDYWRAPEYRIKKPLRNGSKVMMVGDNIYSLDPVAGQWRQADSHHSNSDGSINTHNVSNDTKSNAVLVSDHFYYFGRSAPPVPDDVLGALGYRNRRGYRVFDLDGGGDRLVGWLRECWGSHLNRVSSDPFDFYRSDARYSAETDKVSS